MPTARNAPCPCGRGTKFKRCCALRAADRAAELRREERIGRDAEAWAFARHGDELTEAGRRLTAHLRGSPHAAWITEHPRAGRRLSRRRVQARQGHGSRRPPARRRGHRPQRGRVTSDLRRRHPRRPSHAGSLNVRCGDRRARSARARPEFSSTSSRDCPASPASRLSATTGRCWWRSTRPIHVSSLASCGTSTTQRRHSTRCPPRRRRGGGLPVALIDDALGSRARLAERETIALEPAQRPRMHGRRAAW